MGIKIGETEYTNWNFATDVMELKYKINEKTGEMEKIKEYDMIVVYTDDTINVKACGFVKGSVYHRRDVGTEALIQKRIDHMNDILNN